MGPGRALQLQAPSLAPQALARLRREGAFGVVAGRSAITSLQGRFVSRWPVLCPPEWRTIASFAMDSLRLLRSPRGLASAVATVSVLQDLQPAALRLRAALGRSVSAAAGAEADRRLACEGRLAVFEGSLAQARRLERVLREVGFTTSVNLRAQSQSIEAW